MPTYSVLLIHGTRNAVGKGLVTVGSLTLCRFLVLDLFLFTFRVFCVSIIFQPTTIPTLSPRPNSCVPHSGQILGSFLQLLRRQAPTTSDPAPSKAPTAKPPRILLFDFNHCYICVSFTQPPFPLSNLLGILSNIRPTWPALSYIHSAWSRRRFGAKRRISNRGARVFSLSICDLDQARHSPWIDTTASLVTLRL